MQHKDYWAKRFEQLTEAQLNKGAEYYHNLQEQYRKAIQSVEKDLAKWYTRYATENGISLTEAKRLLSGRELEEFRMDVEEYIKKGKTLKYSNQWAKQLEAASVKVHVSRLEALKVQMQQQAETMYAYERDGIDDLARKVYTDGYYKTAYEVQKGIGVGFDMMRLDKNRIDKLIAKPWAADGKNFSERIWNNRAQLVSELENRLTQSIIRGQSPKKVIAEIAGRFNVNKSKAGRLVMTESAFFASASQRDAFKDLGVERYEVLATLDSRTSPVCRVMDGKVMLMSDHKPGVTAPPFHVYCRSTTVPFFDDEFTIDEQRAARGENGEYYTVPASMKYEDWKKTFVDGGSKDGLKKSTDSGIIIGEKEESPRRNTEGDFGVKWEYVQSEEYSNKFKSLSDNTQAQAAIKTRARWALNNRNGVNTEEIYAIDLDNGKEIGRITNQSIAGGVQRTKGFTEALQKADQEGKKLLLLHNHPKGYPPSISDLNSLLESENASGITVGHDGSIYHYTKPNKVIPNQDWDVALRHFKEYSEITSLEKALQLLAEEYGFTIKRL